MFENIFKNFFKNISKHSKYIIHHLWRKLWHDSGMIRLIFLLYIYNNYQKHIYLS